MKKLKHPNIVTLFDFIIENDYYYIIMEFLPFGDLFNKLVECVSFNEKEARDAVGAIMRGLKHMHDLNIAHRDLKPENLLLTSSSDVFTDIKIADFGFAKWRRDGDAMSTRLGSPSYVAPEILNGYPYTKSVDIWSCGIIMFILLGGYPVSTLTEVLWLSGCDGCSSYCMLMSCLMISYSSLTIFGYSC